MNIEQSIGAMGLSQPETQVYLALLKLGGAKASQLAKEVEMKRTTVYSLLDGLIEKGFVAVYYKKSQKNFKANKPQYIANFFENKLKLFNQAIPILESMEKKQTQAIGLRFIETKEELENFYINILKEYKDKSYRIIGSSQGWESIDPEFFQQFRQERATANIRTKLLVTAESEQLKIKERSLLRTVKYFPEKYSFKSTIDIFDDQILIVSPEMTSLAVVIAIPAMTDIFKSIFEAMWEMVEG